MAGPSISKDSRWQEKTKGVSSGEKVMMLIDGKFLDRYGNVKPNSWDEQSENPTLFNVVHSLSYFYKNGSALYSATISVQNKYTTNGNEWRTMDNDPNPDWSLDEKIAALAYFRFTENEEWLRKIPLFASFRNSSWLSWLRPDVLAYTLACKYEWLVPFLEWIYMTKIEMSLEDYVENPLAESSGAQIAFVMLAGLGYWDAIKQFDEEHGWEGVFKVYYPEEDHPTRKIWKVINE